MKFKLKLLFGILIISTLLISVVSAEESISKTDFKLKLSNSSIEIISNEYSGNNKIFSFELLNASNTSCYIPYYEFNYSFLFVRNVSVSMDLVDKYISCKNDTSNCQLTAQNNITTLSMIIQQKDTEIVNQQTQLETLKKEKTDTENQKWLIAIICVVGSVLLDRFFMGKLNLVHKEKHSNEFNPTSAR